MGPKRSTDRGP